MLVKFICTEREPGAGGELLARVAGRHVRRVRKRNARTADPAASV